MCKKYVTLKEEKVILPDVCIAGLFPMEDFFKWIITLLDVQVFHARSPIQGDYFFLVHQKLFNHFQGNVREKKALALLVLTKPVDLSDSFYSSLPNETWCQDSLLLLI